MSNIIIDKFTEKVMGIDISLSPSHISLQLDDITNISKTISKVKGTKQKKNEEGLKLYKDNVTYVINEDGEEIEQYEEVTYKKKPVAYEDKEVTYTYEYTEGQTIPSNSEIVEKEIEKVTIDKETGEKIVTTETIKQVKETKTIQEVTEYEELDPVMIDNVIEEVITLADNPKKFTLGELLQYKQLDIIKQSTKQYTLADLFLNESDLDLTWQDHKANTGKAIVEILPLGQCKTKPINFGIITKEVEILDFKADEGVELEINYIDDTTIELVFNNTTNELKKVYSYILAY